MNLLAIDSSSDHLVLGLASPKGFFSWTSATGRQHGELLIQEAPKFLQKNSLTLKEIHGIALGRGPGSFTGLRIGASFVQAIALAYRIPVVMPDSLLALAASSGYDKVIVAVKARMGEIYHAIYKRENGQWQAISPPAVLPVGDAPFPEGNGYATAGNGWLFFKDILSARYGDKITSSYEGPIRGEVLLGLAQSLFLEGRTLTSEAVIPDYLRRSVAIPQCERMKKKHT